MSRLDSNATYVNLLTRKYSTILIACPVGNFTIHPRAGIAHCRGDPEATVVLEGSDQLPKVPKPLVQTVCLHHPSGLSVRLSLRWNDLLASIVSGTNLPFHPEPLFSCPFYLLFAYTGVMPCHCQASLHPPHPPTGFNP